MLSERDHENNGEQYKDYDSGDGTAHAVTGLTQKAGMV